MKAVVGSMLNRQAAHGWRQRAVLAVCAVLLVPLPASAQALRIGGNGSGMPTMQMLGAEFAKANPGMSVIVVPNLGSRGGLKALRDGVINLAISTRALKPEESAEGLLAAEYGRTPFVFATHPSVTEPPGSLPELVDAFAGKRETWPDGKPIRLVLRPRYDSDTVLLQSMSPAMKQAVDTGLLRPGMIVATTDQDAADALERTVGALGVTSLSMVRTEQRRLNILKINGVAPDVKTIADGSYPYAKTMYLVRLASANELTMRFQAFVASPKGRQLLLNAGYLVPGG